MPDDLYERDILAWGEQQAALLARLAAGERVNAAIDWPHVVEEVQDLGLSELRACESLLEQAMLHLLKLSSGCQMPANHWRAEIIGFLGRAHRQYTPSMRQRIDLHGLYCLALRQAVAAGTVAPSAVPPHCPYTLQDLLAPEPDIAALLARLDGSLHA